MEIGGLIMAYSGTCWWENQVDSEYKDKLKTYQILKENIYVKRRNSQKKDPDKRFLQIRIPDEWKITVL